MRLNANFCDVSFCAKSQNLLVGASKVERLVRMDGRTRPFEERIAAPRSGRSRAFQLSPIAYTDMISSVRAAKTPCRLRISPVPAHLSSLVLRRPAFSLIMGSRLCTHCLEKSGAMVLRRIRCRSCDSVANTPIWESIVSTSMTE